MSSNSSLSEDMNITVLVDNEDQREFITHRSPETPQHVWTPMEPLSSSTPIPMDIRPQFFMTHIPMGAAHPTPWTSYSYNPPGRVNPILRNIAAYNHPGFAIPEYQNFGVYYERVVLTTISQPRSSASCKPLGLATAKPQYNSYNPWGAAIPQPQSMTQYKPQSSTTPELQRPSDSVTPKPSGPEIPQELTFAQRVDQYHKDFGTENVVEYEYVPSLSLYRVKQKTNPTEKEKNETSVKKTFSEILNNRHEHNFKSGNV